MIIPEVFKYSSIISVPFFGFVSYLLIRYEPDYSFFKHTISKSVLFLNHPVKFLVFRLNFIIKALLDLGFAFYVIYRFDISLKSPISWFMILSAFLFGLLAYFIEGKYSFFHSIFTYGSGIFYMIGQILLVQLTHNSPFIFFTNMTVIIVNIFTWGFMLAKKTNVFVQMLCVGILYFWLIIFVSRFM
jgi:hypothetical protein